MSKLRLAVVLAAFVALLVPGVAAAKDYKLEAQQWRVSNGPLKTNVAYSMRNLVNNQHVGYGERTWGINLVWKSTSSEWKFTPDTGSPNIRDHRVREFAPTDKVSLFNTKINRYLVYESRSFGINLGWSKTPNPQWKAERNADGEVSLYNTRAGDHVVYGTRGVGINLRWLKDVKRDAAQNGVGSIHKATVFMTAQPVVQGYIPFLGSYGGGGTKAVLTKVTNAHNNVQMNFVKPNYSTTQCGQSGATLPLGPNQTMSADTMKALWGSATPSLANRLNFLACAAGAAGSSVFVNVEYRITG